MDDEKTTTKPSKASKADDGGAAEVTAKLEAEQEQGFRGAEVDPTPNHAYTVAGVTAGEATPETDADAKKTADEALGRK